MPQTCPACLWISSDAAEECERCGEPFSGKRQPEPLASTLGTIFKTLVGLLALSVLVTIAIQRFGRRVPVNWETLKTALTAFYTWLLGPNEIFKPYLVTVLVITLITWVVLWLLARLQ